MIGNIHPVSISSRACEEIRHIMQTKGIPPEYGLRVGIRGGGCGGLSLIIGFDKKRDTDLSYAVEDIPVYVDKKHAMYVIGKEVDFVDEADERGFLFKDAVQSGQ